MERVRGRDTGAFEALYDTYNRLVYGIALRVLGEAGAAEDVTQAIFMKLWTDPGSFTAGNFNAWIVRVARNRALDAVRARGVRSHDDLPEILPAEDALEDTALADIDARAVRGALAQLPEEQRVLIEMGFFGGVTHHEIAQRTGVPLGTVKTRIRSGLRRLRTALDGVVNV